MTTDVTLDYAIRLARQICQNGKFDDKNDVEQYVCDMVGTNATSQEIFKATDALCTEFGF